MDESNLSLKEENRKLRKILKETKDELRSVSDRLNTIDRQKDEFISMAAHELRAPTTAIKGYLSMMLNGDAGDISERVRGYLADAQATNDRLIRLVNNMINVSRIEEGKITYQIDDVKLSALAGAVYSDFKFEAERKKLGFSTEIQENVNDLVKVDPDRIREVVANMVSNAIKYTNEGFVKIKVLDSSGGMVRLEVVDSGPGISEEEQSKIFRKFYRVKSAVGKTIGTGLGLYISKLIIKSFDGEIGVDSRMGSGSTFWFELPRQ
ncbi:HAMP domain-containing histidine kinase [Candidatus Woesebacteria bacterium]|nr:HAMP domain-containing histidine kinase [Candidatus Woesebacteria bacterium]